MTGDEMRKFVGAVRRWRYALRNGGSPKYLSELRAEALRRADALGYEGPMTFLAAYELVDLAYAIVSLNPGVSAEQVAAALDAAGIVRGVA